jgi:hypothetical protein
MIPSPSTPGISLCQSNPESRSAGSLAMPVVMVMPVMVMVRRRESGVGSK